MEPTAKERRDQIEHFVAYAYGRLEDRRCVRGDMGRVVHAILRDTLEDAFEAWANHS